uniref:LITAF domain-containing protein n=1 Tax=Panagrolaimus sp. JU765 TaxID=591449 RepID=A0AC34RFD3_9BILA
MTEAPPEVGINAPLKININSAFWPIAVTCPKCSAEVYTECRYRWGIWNFFTLFCCQDINSMGGLPYWSKWYRDVVHICPKCREEICHLQKCPCCIPPIDDKKDKEKAGGAAPAAAPAAAAPAK